MAIINNICMNCEKSHVCKWINKVDAFDEGKKNPIGVTIRIENCEEYKEVE